jgi:hypothetical protein
MSLQALLEEVSRHHFPYPPATAEEIEAFERRMGWRLDSDLRAFYLHCNGAELFERVPECPYRILPLSEITRARVAIFEEDDDQYGPASVYALWHEAWPDPEYCKQITHSFSEFLERALRSEGYQFWLKQDGT